MVALLGGPERSVGQASRARQDGFGSRRQIAERAVRLECVVMLAPASDQDLGLPQRVEDFPVEQFASELAVEPKAGEANLSL